MLDGCNFVDWNKVLDDHVDKFELSHNGSVFLFKLFSFLNHKLLNIVISFIGCLEFIVDLCQLLSAVLNLLFETEVLLLHDLYV